MNNKTINFNCGQLIQLIGKTINAATVIPAVTIINSKNNKCCNFINSGLFGYLDIWIFGYLDNPTLRFCVAQPWRGL